MLVLANAIKLNAQFYNGTQTTFGKNRVQYRDFEWQFYRFNKFETYFYTGGKELAVHTAKYANQELKKVERLLDFNFQDKVQFIIYNKQSDFRQSNIGLNTQDNFNIGGVTRIIGSKVFIYFEGDYEKFNQQIKAGILRVLIYQMIYGGNWRQVIRNSALLHLPEWYINGLVSYLSDPYNADVMSKIKDGILNEDYRKFNTLSNKNAKIAGHAIWEYIGETYDNGVISNVLYITKVSREINDGFLYVISASFEDLYAEMLSYYKNKYDEKNKADNLGVKQDIKTRKNTTYQNFKVGPSNSYSIYSSNKLGQYKIYLYDQTNGKRKKIFKKEHRLERIQDYSYPIMNWHPSGKLFTFIVEEKGELLLYTYNIEENNLSSRPIFKVDKVLSYNYAQDGKTFVFSGVSNGQSDIYIYNILGNTQLNLTNDLYDDLEPIYSEDGKTIYFVSNRLNDSLNIEHEINNSSTEKDLFTYDLYTDEISSITNTIDKDEYTPLEFDGQLFYLINDEGKVKRFTAEYDSSINRIDTIIHYDYYYETELSDIPSRNILSQNASNDGINQIIYKESKNQFYSYLPKNDQKSQENSSSNSNVNGSLRTYIPFKRIEQEQIIREVDIYNYDLIGNPSETTAKEKLKEQKVIANQEELEFPTQRLYRLNFRPDNSVLQLNNMFINSQYQIFNGGPYINAGLGLNSKIGIVDLMENHRIYGGFRYSGDLIEYSLSYQNLKRRLDKEYSISRTRLRRTDVGIPNDQKTIKANLSLSWPFSEVTSLRGVISARNDKFIPLSTDRLNLEVPTFNEYWATVKLAYVYDNTRDVSLNIRYGLRFKLFAEQYQLVYRDLEQSEISDLTVIGFDVRHYQKIHKEFIWVNRIAGSKSFGTNPLIYYLGGVDEWWKSNQFDQGTPIDFSQNYGFQSLAANMRGFLQNVRNGSSFVVYNSELRLPVFSYLINRPIQSSFIRNFQFVGFADIGTAWEGTSPFDEDNPINNETKTVGQITVTYENINEPLVAGVGFGLRTTLLGYFVRADWGWGIENGDVSKKSLFMFSLSLDI